MVSNSITRDADGAVRLGNDLLRMGLLYHVSYKYPFLDKPHFYMCEAMLTGATLPCCAAEVLALLAGV